MSAVLQTATILLGIGITIWAADRFVDGAAQTARALGVPALVVGLTVMALGTSGPEIAASILAAAQGYPALAIGNALGSNIANIGLIIGLTAMIVPLKLASASLRRELPLLVLVKLVTILLIANGELGRAEGLAMLVMLVLALLWIIRIALTPGRDDPLLAELNSELPAETRMAPALFNLFLGLLLLLGAAQLLVWGAVGLAGSLGVSDLVIGLSIVAIGTSLPELATCIAAVLKRQHDIAVGNVIGSNLFNLLAVLPLPALIAPGPLPSGILGRDFPVMLGLTLLLIILARGFTRHGSISRGQGLLLFALFIAYQLGIFIAWN